MNLQKISRSLAGNAWNIKSQIGKVTMPCALEATAADGSSEVRRRRRASPRLEAEVVYAAPASEAVAEAAAAAPKATSQVQSARDEYRKNRFAGSSILKALALAGAKPQPLSEGGSYAG